MADHENSTSEESQTPPNPREELLEGLSINDDPVEEVAQDATPEPEVVEEKTEPAPEVTDEVKLEAEIEQPKPGTPDKYIQKLAMQQSEDRKELGEIKASITALAEAINKQGGKPTPAQNEQIAELKEQASEVTKKITGESDPYETQVIIDSRLEAVEKREKEREAKTAALEKQLQDLLTQRQADEAQSKNDKVLAGWKQQYPNADPKAEWEASIQQAKDEGLEEAGAKAVEIRAQKVFRERLEATKKAAPAKVEPKKAGTQPAQTARPVPPKTPSGARVTVPNGKVPPKPVPQDPKSRHEALLERLS